VLEWAIGNQSKLRGREPSWRDARSDPGRSSEIWKLSEFKDFLLSQRSIVADPIFRLRHDDDLSDQDNKRSHGIVFRLGTPVSTSMHLTKAALIEEDHSN